LKSAEVVTKSCLFRWDANTRDISISHQWHLSILNFSPYFAPEFKTRIRSALFGIAGPLRRNEMNCNLFTRSHFRRKVFDAFETEMSWFVTH
jgi:hypothetical protein